MTRNRIITLCVLLLCTCLSLEAQSQRTNRRTRTRTNKVQKKEATVKADTVAVTPQPEEPKPEEPKYKSLTDPLVVRYLSGGFAKDNKLHLITNPDYAALAEVQKRDILNKVAQEFVGYNMMLYTGGQQRELWISDGNNVRLIEKWNNDSLRIEDYMPLELKRSGRTKLFYYIGGTFNGSKDNKYGSLNFRGGSYLYKDYLDASLTLNLGFTKNGDDSKFAGDIGVDSRGYLPFRIKKVNLAPYIGAGISWSFAPDKFFEFRALAGGCWFIGPGSLDIGLQYGTESKFSLALGYTFRIPTKKKQK